MVETAFSYGKRIDRLLLTSGILQDKGEYSVCDLKCRYCVFTLWGSIAKTFFFSLWLFHLDFTILWFFDLLDKEFWERCTSPCQQLRDDEKGEVENPEWGRCSFWYPVDIGGTGVYGSTKMRYLGLKRDNVRTQINQYNIQFLKYNICLKSKTNMTWCALQIVQLNRQNSGFLLICFWAPANYVQVNVMCPKVAQIYICHLCIILWNPIQLCWHTCQHYGNL